MMAKATGLSQTGAMRIWHAYALLPHRAKLSADLLFIEKVRDGCMGQHNGGSRVTSRQGRRNRGRLRL
jgi:hypothetical protein